MLELGEQNLRCAGHLELAGKFVSVFSGSGFRGDAGFEALIDGGLSGELFELAGFKFICTDIFEGKHTRVLDLNFDVTPDDFVEAFDVVTNFGTTEHILNQYNCFKFIHDCTKIGGLMVHQLPMQGWSDHCFVRYSPKFFFLLAAANSYTLIDFRINVGSNCTNNVSYWTTLQGSALGPKSSTGNPDQNKGIFFVLRKDEDRPFLPPLDRTSGPLTSQELSQIRRFDAAATS